MNYNDKFRVQSRVQSSECLARREGTVTEPRREEKKKNKEGRDGSLNTFDFNGQLIFDLI